MKPDIVNLLFAPEPDEPYDPHRGKKVELILPTEIFVPDDDCSMPWYICTGKNGDDPPPRIYYHCKWTLKVKCPGCESTGFEKLQGYTFRDDRIRNKAEDELDAVLVCPECNTVIETYPLV